MSTLSSFSPVLGALQGLGGGGGAGYGGTASGGTATNNSNVIIGTSGGSLKDIAAMVQLFNASPSPNGGFSNYLYGEDYQGLDRSQSSLPLILIAAAGLVLFLILK